MLDVRFIFPLSRFMNFVKLSIYSLIVLIIFPTQSVCIYEVTIFRDR